METKEEKYSKGLYKERFAKSKKDNLGSYILRRAQRESAKSHDLSYREFCKHHSKTGPRLSEQERMSVLETYAKSDCPLSQIAKIYGIDKSTVSRIAKNYAGKVVQFGNDYQVVQKRGMPAPLNEYHVQKNLEDIAAVLQVQEAYVKRSPHAQKVARGIKKFARRAAAAVIGAAAGLLLTAILHSPLKATGDSIHRMFHPYSPQTIALNQKQPVSEPRLEEITNEVGARLKSEPYARIQSDYQETKNPSKQHLNPTSNLEAVASIHPTAVSETVSPKAHFYQVYADARHSGIISGESELSVKSETPVKLQKHKTRMPSADYTSSFASCPIPFPIFPSTIISGVFGALGESGNVDSDYREIALKKAVENAKVEINPRIEKLLELIGPISKWEVDEGERAGNLDPENLVDNKTFKKRMETMGSIFYVEREIKKDACFPIFGDMEIRKSYAIGGAGLGNRFRRVQMYLKRIEKMPDMISEVSVRETINGKVKFEKMMTLEDFLADKTLGRFR